MTLQLVVIFSAWTVINVGALIQLLPYNGVKSWSVVKEGVVDTAREVSHGFDVQITTEGHYYLDDVIDFEAFE